jgi:hypothetical protein
MKHLKRRIAAAALAAALLVGGAAGVAAHDHDEPTPEHAGATWSRTQGATWS